MKALRTLVTLACMTTLAAGAHAQRASGGEVPREYRPPAGMCRIWIEGVPAAQQPAPTDCATAVRNRPEKGRVIFGDDYVDQKRQPLPPQVRHFAEPPANQPTRSEPRNEPRNEPARGERKSDPPPERKPDPRAAPRTKGNDAPPPTPRPTPPRVERPKPR